MPRITNEVNLPNLKINKLSQEAYANLYNSDALKDDEIYLVDGGDAAMIKIIDWSSNESNS